MYYAISLEGQKGLFEQKTANLPVPPTGKVQKSIKCKIS